MIREVVGQQLDHDPNFRWRGESVTRIENLSDIAFAVALGMIVSGVDAPSTFPELIRFLIFIIPAAACFAVQIWTAHYTFFRRYGVADRTIIVLNAVLIFLILYMAYPLRFVFDSLFAWIIGASTGDVSRYVEIGVMSFETSGEILAIFGAIYAAVYVNLALMYRYIRTKHETLDLNAYESSQTDRDHIYYWLAAILCVVVSLVAWLTPLNGFAGFFLSFNGLIAAFLNKRYPLPVET
ncbi:MAG: hypothetical protein AAFP97_05790 [Pseudomonadota bacterium]